MQTWLGDLTFDLTTTQLILEACRVGDVSVREDGEINRDYYRQLTAELFESATKQAEQDKRVIEGDDDEPVVFGG